jgi:hypothetical protein
MTSGIGTEGLVRLSTPTRCLTRDVKQPANVLERPSPCRPGLGDDEGKEVGLGGLLGTGREPVVERGVGHVVFTVGGTGYRKPLYEHVGDR